MLTRAPTGPRGRCETCERGRLVSITSICAPRRTASTEGQFTCSHRRAMIGEATSTRRLESSGGGASARLDGR